MIRAVICDLYNTLLDVGPPPAAARACWEQLRAGVLPTRPELTLEELETATRAVTLRHHAAARARGVDFPEVVWPDVLREAFPELGGLPEFDLNVFIGFHTAMLRRVSLASGAAECLAAAQRAGAVLGIASNAQHYTLLELEVALDGAPLAEAAFDPGLRFLSWQHGFAKPSPRVFAWLTERLAARGIAPEQTLMVGDREDNDCLPAAAAGWQTWHYGPGRGWAEMRARYFPEGATEAPAR